MSKKTLAEKLLAFQTEVGAISKDSNNPFYNSQYFDINKLLKIIKPLLSKHGIILLQPLTFTTVNDSVYPMLNTMLVNADNSEDMLQFTTSIPSLSDPQKQGGVVTYFRRYALVSLLSLEAEDDDGNAASGKNKAPAKASAKQAPKKSNPLVW